MRGAPSEAIQELAGHADLAMTQRYMHLSPEALDTAISLERPSGDQGGFASRRLGCVRSERRLAVRQGFEPWVQV
jgi:hypothetical protein